MPDSPPPPPTNQKRKRKREKPQQQQCDLSRREAREKARDLLQLDLVIVLRDNLLRLIDLLVLAVAKALIGIVPGLRRLDALLGDIVHGNGPALGLAHPRERAVGKIDRVLDGVVRVAAGRERHREIVRHTGELDRKFARLRGTLVLGVEVADLLVAVGAARADRAGGGDLGVELLVGLPARVDVSRDDHLTLLQLLGTVGVFAFVHSISVIGIDPVGHGGFPTALLVCEVILLTVVVGLADAGAVGIVFGDLAVGRAGPGVWESVRSEQ